jgi:hypothetical protein
MAAAAPENISLSWMLTGLGIPTVATIIVGSLIVLLLRSADTHRGFGVVVTASILALSAGLAVLLVGNRSTLAVAVAITSEKPSNSSRGFPISEVRRFDARQAVPPIV